MDVLTLLDEATKAGLSVSVDGESLCVRGAKSAIATVQKLADHKSAIIRYLAPPPYLNGGGDLIIPHNTPTRYRYWAGGQSIASTLAELNAPPQTWQRYLPYSDSIKNPLHNSQCSAPIQSCGQIRFCPSCRWFAIVD